MTIKELAAYANVSVATVSRVLNGNPLVRPETREAVRRAVEETGYTTNSLGRNLRILKSDVVLVVMPNIENPFYADIVAGIDKRCRELGLNAMICNTYDSHEKLRHYCGYIDLKQARGVILISPTWKRDYKFLEGMPVVSCCETYEELPCSQVNIDNTRAGFDATQYLISLGAKRIAYIGGGQVAASGVEREKGFRDAMKEAGLPVEETLVDSGCFSYEQGLESARRIFSTCVPDGVFAWSDEIAIAFMSEARARGISIPKQMKVIGFDNIRYSTFVTPQLSTVDQPRYEIGARAVNELMRVLDGNPPRTIRCPYTLLKRGSTEEEDKR